eukprot:6462173-Amphidinium_carterae.1
MKAQPSDESQGVKRNMHCNKSELIPQATCHECKRREILTNDKQRVPGTNGQTRPENQPWAKPR